uniref:Uncharacterized protein n=1 Tax=Arundo donax TaxID=35708 RepID=A0A0A9GAG4_ARUDO
MVRKSSGIMYFSNCKYHISFSLSFVSFTCTCYLSIPRAIRICQDFGTIQSVFKHFSCFAIQLTFLTSS